MHTVVQILIFVFIDHIDDPDQIHVLQQDIRIEEREAIKNNDSLSRRRDTVRMCRQSQRFQRHAPHLLVL